VLQNPFSPYGGPPQTPLPADPVARQIAEEQAALWAETASRASGGVTVRARSGTPGLDQLADISAPLEASIVPDGIGGRIAASVTPVLLDNGTLSGTANILRFGSNAGTGKMAVPTTNTAEGVGLGVSYHLGKVLSADIGSSPLGFPVSTVVGGIEIAPQLSDDVTLRLRGERRIITDSLLSYAGERDPVSGTTWGGVTRNGGHGQLELGFGAGGYAYAGGGYNIVTGQNVAQNNEVEAAAINVPLDYRSTWGPLQYHLRGILGYDTFREEGSPLFPLDPLLQAAADAAAAENPNIPSHNIAQNKAGVVGGIRIDLRYPLTDVLAISGGLSFDQAPQWEQGSVYVRLDGEF
jgi:cellulose synthase operon protein C